jgi:hypothetical protein
MIRPRIVANRIVGKAVFVSAVRQPFANVGSNAMTIVRILLINLTFVFPWSMFRPYPSVKQQRM